MGTKIIIGGDAGLACEELEDSEAEEIKKSYLLPFIL